jgi:hypothetical protein
MVILIFILSLLSVDISVGVPSLDTVVGDVLVGVTGCAVGVGDIAVSVEERVGVTAVSAGAVDVVVDSGVQAAMRIIVRISTIIRLYSLIILPPGWGSFTWLWLPVVEMIRPWLGEDPVVRRFSSVDRVFPVAPDRVNNLRIRSGPGEYRLLDAV